MTKFKWQTVRIFLMALLLVGALATLVRALVVPQPKEDEKRIDSYDFPQAIPLPNWQQIDTQPLEAQRVPQYPGQLYQYRQQGQQLEIEVRYERYTDGNFSRLINIYTPMEPGRIDFQIKRQDGIGHYVLFEEEDQAYLSSCLNPVGESTITEQQFVQNRYRHSWSVQRLALWAIGQNDLLDGRCFWTLLSMPIPAEGEDREGTYQTLESTWFDWYRWWQQKL